MASRAISFAWTSSVQANLPPSPPSGAFFFFLPLFCLRSAFAFSCAFRRSASAYAVARAPRDFLTALAAATPPCTTSSSTPIPAAVLVVSDLLASPRRASCTLLT